MAGWMDGEEFILSRTSHLVAVYTVRRDEVIEIPVPRLCRL